MAHIKTTFALSVLAHTFALASIAVVLPEGAKFVEKELTQIELVTMEQAAQKAQTTTAPFKKIARPEKRELQASPVAMTVSEKVEQARQETRQEPVVPVPAAAPVQKAAITEPLPMYRHVEAPAPVAAQALIKESEPRPVAASRSSEAAFNSYVIQKIDRAKLYPNWAKQRGYEGNVMVSFKLNPDGSVSDIKVVGPCECDILNKAACESIKRAAPFNGVPIVESRARDMKVNIGFKLQK